MYKKRYKKNLKVKYSYNSYHNMYIICIQNTDKSKLYNIA